MPLRAADARRGRRGSQGGGLAIVAGACLSMLVLCAGGAGRADGGAGQPSVGLAVNVACEPIPGPGKVQCVVQVRPLGGALRWGDAIVTAAPAFAAPLRTRVNAGDARRNDAEGADFSLALGATADGTGELRVLARGTVCGDGGCRPAQAEGVTRVQVGGEKLAPEAGPR